MLFEIRIQRSDENDKLIKENYLVEAESFSEAEKNIIREFQVSQDDVLSIRRSLIVETYYDNAAGPYYRAKFIRTYMDDNGKEKVSAWYMAARFENTEAATNGFANILSTQGYDDMVLSDVVLTKFIALV